MWETKEKKPCTDYRRQRLVKLCDYPGLEDVCLYQTLFLARLKVHQGSKALSDWTSPLWSLW